MSHSPIQSTTAKYDSPAAVNGESSGVPLRNGEPETRLDALDPQSTDSPRRPPRKRRSPLAGFWYSLLWCACFAISKAWFRFRFVGKDCVPTDGPVLLVSNHQSHLDPVLVGVACPRQLKYLARQDLFFWPFSLWIRSLGAVPIDRKRGALGGIRTTLNLLKNDEAVLVFPEGSRTHDGELQSFLSGFCLLARRSGATIVPVAIDGAFEAMPRGSVFARPAPIRLTFCQPIAQSQYAGLTDEELVQRVFAEVSDALATSRTATT